MIESRGAADDARDLAMLQALRQRHALAGPLRFEHVAGPVEPLLWAADVVCGAVNEARTENPTYVELLPALRTVLVDDRLRRETPGPACGISQGSLPGSPR